LTVGFYPVEVIIGDARRHGVPILPPDVNRSQAACTLESRGSSTAVRLGLRYVHGLGEAWQARVVERRGSHLFRDLRDFCQRTRLPRSVVENLIRAGAMDSFGQTRRDLLWELGGLAYREEGLDVEVSIEPVALPTLGQVERLGWEYELLGMTPGDHVVGLYRERLREHGVLSSGELATRRDRQTVRVAGRVVVRQRPRGLSLSRWRMKKGW